MDLFEYQREKNLEKESPLSSRIRPKILQDFIGQEHIIGKDTFLYRCIKIDKFTNMIFYGPSGTGKTSLANIISQNTKNNFVKLNGIYSGIKELKEIIDDAKDIIATNNKRTIVFIDEIHRFNKSQQDVLLPYMEDGTIILIGATTENPFFEINKSIISRSNILEFYPLSPDDIKKGILKSINSEDGLSIINVDIDNDALDFLSIISNGDLRIALNAIELASMTTDPNENNKIFITKSIIEQCVQKKAISYDKNGNGHYDIISAFIKSIRGSDPNGALFYLAVMLEAGEDIKFIARRIIISAAEDIGNADPQALTLAVSAANAIQFVGMPEARIILAQAVTYIASAPKSNASYLGINKALEDIKSKSFKTIPPYLKSEYNKISDISTYKYPHNYKNHYVNQQYLPDEFKNQKYYIPTENGKEKELKEYLESLKNE